MEKKPVLKWNKYSVTRLTCIIHVLYAEEIFVYSVWPQVSIRKQLLLIAQLGWDLRVYGSVVYFAKMKATSFGKLLHRNVVLNGAKFREHFPKTDRHLQSFTINRTRTMTKRTMKNKQTKNTKTNKQTIRLTSLFAIKVNVTLHTSTFTAIKGFYRRVLIFANLFCRSLIKIRNSTVQKDCRLFFI